MADMQIISGCEPPEARARTLVPSTFKAAPLQCILKLIGAMNTTSSQDSGVTHCVRSLRILDAPQSSLDIISSRSLEGACCSNQQKQSL